MIFSHLIPTRSKISSRRTQTRGPVPMRSAVSDSLHCSSDTTPTTSRNWPREEREKRRRGTREHQNHVSGAPPHLPYPQPNLHPPSTQSPPFLNQISILPQPESPPTYTPYLHPLPLLPTLHLAHSLTPYLPSKPMAITLDTPNESMGLCSSSQVIASLPGWTDTAL